MKDFKAQFHAENKRFAFIDLFRGLALSGMILVNNPGSWKHRYGALVHADWNGCSFADLLFPFFLFVMGAAMALSTRRYMTDRVKCRQNPYPHVLKRTVVLFSLGLMLNLLSNVLYSGGLDLHHLRIMGVLQRIALSYLLASLVVLNMSVPGIILLCSTVLPAYWLVMTAVTVPGAELLSEQAGPAVLLDRIILGRQHMYLGGAFDPEGILSTVPSVVTVLCGYLSCVWLLSRPFSSRTSFKLSAAGFVMLLSGLFWGRFFPVNKSLWTSSFVLVSGGWAAMIMALCYEVSEVRGWKRAAWPFQVMGRNSLILFAGSGVVSRLIYMLHFKTPRGLQAMSSIVYEHLFLPFLDPSLASVCFSLLYLLLWWIILYLMYCRRWFLTV